MEGLVPFAAALGLIVVLELGDKTQLVTISLASRYPGLPVLAGAALGLALVTAIGAAVGTILAEALAGAIVAIQIGGGIAFIGLGAVGLLRPRREKEPTRDRFRNAFVQAFSTNALAEIGDKTQLAVIVLAATTAAPISIFLGSTLGLTAVATSSVIVGNTLSRVVRADRMRIAAATLFIVAGILLIFEALAKG